MFPFLSSIPIAVCPASLLDRGVSSIQLFHLWPLYVASDARMKSRAWRRKRHRRRQEVKQVVKELKVQGGAVPGQDPGYIRAGEPQQRDWTGLNSGVYHH